MEDTHYSYVSVYILQILTLEEPSPSEISQWPEACIMNAVSYGQNELKKKKKKWQWYIGVRICDNTGHTGQTKPRRILTVASQVVFVD